jgi:hypothetical protein
MMRAGNPEQRQVMVREAAADSASRQGVTATLTWADGLPDAYRDTAMTQLGKWFRATDLSALLEYATPRGADGTLTSAQISLLRGFEDRGMTGLTPEAREQLQKWARSPANPGGFKFRE